MSAPILEVSGLKVHFFTPEGVVRAVDDIDFTLERGKVLGLVGESGCGKSVTAQALLQIVPDPGRIVAGQMLYRPDPQREAIDIAKLGNRGPAIRNIRGQEIAMVFQEPAAAFCPVYTVGNQLGETFFIHGNTHISRAEAKARSIRLLEEVGIPKADLRIDQYPFQLSGGMRQRAFIAMCLAGNPKILIADEPTTAVDVTIQAQILDLIKREQQQRQMAVILITHNFGIVAEMADEVAVMYLGKIVEQGSVLQIFDRPLHPYTRALLEAIPKLTRRTSARLMVIKGSVPPPFFRPQGCYFRPRCTSRIAGVCKREDPPLIEMEPGHKVRCFLYTEGAASKEGRGHE